MVTKEQMLQQIDDSFNSEDLEQKPSVFTQRMLTWSAIRAAVLRDCERRETEQQPAPIRLDGYAVYVPDEAGEGVYYLPEHLTSQALTIERAELHQRRMADIGYPCEIRLVSLTIQARELNEAERAEEANGRKAA